MSKQKFRIIGMLMLLVLLIATAGCGKEAAGTSSDTADASSNATSDSSDTSEAGNTGTNASAEESSNAATGDAQTIVGTWDTALDMSGLVNMVLTMGDEDIASFFQIDQLKFPLQFTFNGDGTYGVSADEAAIQASMDGLKEDALNGYNHYFEYLIEQEGADMTVEDMLAELGFDSIEEYVDLLIGGFDTSEPFDSSGEWKIENGKLYMTEEIEGVEDSEYFSYELTAGTLTLLELHMEGAEDGLAELFGELMDGLFPIVMTRAE